jgi:hypothetical protein
MTHIDLMIAWFKRRGGSATLGEILRSGEPWAYEWRARATNLRQKTRYDLQLVRGQRANDNRYSLVEKPYMQTEIAA